MRARALYPSSRLLHETRPVEFYSGALEAEVTIAFTPTARRWKLRRSRVFTSMISRRASICRSAQPLIYRRAWGVNGNYFIITLISSFFLWPFLHRSAWGNTKGRQVRKRAASSCSLLPCRCVDFHVACVLWTRLWLSGRSCGQSGIDLSSSMHLIKATSSCHRTSCACVRACVCVCVEVRFTEIDGSPWKAIEAFISRMRRGNSSFVQDMCLIPHFWWRMSVKPHLKCSSS